MFREPKPQPKLLPSSPAPTSLPRSIYTRPPSLQPFLVEEILIRPPIFETIFSNLSPASLVRFARLCRLARIAISLFFERAFNVNRHLLRFVSNPISFRSLQARTGTLISGSNALQFLDRTFYPESDLDLYTHPGHAKEVGVWLIHEGYTFLPGEEQSPDFSELDWSSWNPWDITWPRTDINWDDMHVTNYRIPGLEDIYQFEKPSPSDGQALRVQIIAAEHTPLQCILGFHSTCVMNFIAFDAAYSIYPRATFEERRTLSFARLTARDIRCLSKYALRGWSTLSNIWPHEPGVNTTFYVDRQRWVNDSLSWVVPLDTTGVELRSRLSPVSEPFVWDPVLHNSWVLTKPDDLSKMYLSYHILKTTLFRYTYLFADIKLIDSLRPFMTEQGPLEHSKKADIPADQMVIAWTWWDAILPEYVRRYLGKTVVAAADAMDTT